MGECCFQASILRVAVPGVCDQGTAVDDYSDSDVSSMANVAFSREPQSTAVLPSGMLHAFRTIALQVGDPHAGLSYVLGKSAKWKPPSDVQR